MRVRDQLTSGPWPSRLRWGLRLFTPWGLEWWMHGRAQMRLQRQVVESQRRSAAASPEGSLQRRMEDAIAFLVGRGLDEEMVRAGSIPGESLEFMSAIVGPRLPAGRPVRTLHIGNFVGLSLWHLTGLVRELDPGSVVVSVDPNTTHRGVGSPQEHVLALLDRDGLLSHSIVIPGYTLEQTLGEPGALEHVDLSQGRACTEVLASLATLGLHHMDLVLIDGNHDLEYLEREFEALGPLLAPGSIVVLDDVVEWDGVRELFERVLADEHFSDLGHDGRLGVVQRTGR